jgi:cyclic beta-1,2-glucan synthetase
VDEVTHSLRQTVKTLGRLERHEGHLLNWYDIATLTPLKPGYVSTVDSGNLLGALWTVERGISRTLRTPVFDGRSFHGLWDAAESLRLAMERGNGPTAPMQPLFEAMKVWDVPPEGIRDSLLLLREAREGLGGLGGTAAAEGPVMANVAKLTGKVWEQISSWGNIADRYLGWIDILGERSIPTIADLDPRAVPSFRRALISAPSLEDLATGNLAWIPFLRAIRERAVNDDLPTVEWADRVFEALDRSKWLAGEMLASAGQLLRELRELSDSMRMLFLYDVGRRLFSIGFNVAEGRLDRAYYDLLASEARLGSFVAIARGEIPAEHWFAMNRPYGVVGRRTVLLSWTGTMFEYLMPLLFLRTYANSLLDKAVREAVAVQIGYGHTHRVPWGISESASGDLDVHKTYQYNAFGVPLLGLKRGLADKTVIAPYATLLAVNVAPRESLRNLRRLASLGLLGDYGYYDAIDFSQQPTREGGRGVIVQTYMAHHQGMGFLALVNLLHGNSLQNHFHDDPRVRAVEPLLHERIPHLPLLNQISTRARISSVAAIGEVAPSVSHFSNPHTPSPKTQILSNGRYSLMLTNAGGGYARWGDADLTRWRSDRTRDSWGTFCYIYDSDANRLWCNTYQPTGGKVEGYNADFSLDRAVFRRFDFGIQCDTEIIVAPDDDAEIRRMTLVNRTLRSSRLDITSYLELSLAPHNTDRQHPAFNKLFIETEAVPERRALLAFRRPRYDMDPQVYIGHRFTLEEEGQEPVQFETERARFIGRGQTLVRPLGAVHVPGNSQGFVLDPILSLRQTVTLEAGQRIQISMITVAAGNRDDVLRLLERYSSARTIDRAMDSAWTSAQLELHLLRIQPDDARRFQQVASHLLFPNPLLRAPADRIAENRKGQAALWTYGISGDFPVALIVIGESEDLSLVRQMLKAHHYWRLHGLSVDLVILNEEAVGYDRPLHEQLERLLHAHAGKEGLDRPGGIYLRATSVIPKEDLTLLRAVARTVMVAARGNLPQQLGAPSDVPDAYEQIASKRISRDRSAALPFMELSYFNSIGGFTPDGLEYAIYLGPGIHTPMPWVNVIANPSFGTVISESGAGFTWQGNSQRNRLTEWSNDPVSDPPSEAIYIRDEETGAFWTPTAMPIREETAYRARFGAGYGVFEHNSHGIEQELTVFVPLDDNGGEPIKLQKLLLKNDSGRTRKLSVTYYVEWTLGESREASQDQIVTAWDDEVESITAHNYYHPDYGDQIAFAAISTPTESHTADRTSFLGRNRSMHNPVGMERGTLSRRTGAALDPCAALRTTVRLAEGEQVEITCMLGQTRTVREARSLILTYRSGPAVNEALEQVKGWWSNRLGMIQVRTPDLAINLLVNRWLLYQTLSCRVWGRSAFYQSGGAFGFRDQLQDVMALLYAHPDLARQHILRAAGRQFVEGDVQHWWHMPGGEGIRSRISDDLLWLPFVVAQYIRITGDETILAESVAFLDALPLEEAERERFQKPGNSSETGTIFEHCRRATARGTRYGPHALPLMGTGDWNDGMNLVGAGGKGESIWLAWFLVDVLKGMEELSDIFGRKDLSRMYRLDSTTLRESIEGFAWDGEWYLRATFDDGTLLGASSGREARIDSLPQSWAWLCGVADRERAVTALESAWSHLVREEEGLVLLFEPPFDTMVPSPGYIKGYPPGVRENGGQYTHAAIWLAMAMARRGDGTRAAKIMGMLNPIEHARDQDAVWRYGIEPYAVAADIYRLPDRIGKGGWSWYTGSSAWMYRCWVEEIVGLHVRGNSLSVAPVIPGWWDGFDIAYRHGEAIYEIRVENPDHVENGVAWVEMDGKRLAGDTIPLSREFVKHRIAVRMGGSVSLKAK